MFCAYQIIAASFKSSSVGEYTFAEVLESSSSDADLAATLDEMLVSFFEEERAPPTAGKLVQLLLASNASSLERKNALIMGQWASGAQGGLPGALLVPLARFLLEKDPTLFAELASHPAFQAAVKDDSGKGKAEVSTDQSHLLEALIVCTAASDDKEDPVVKGVTFALTSGSLKEVLLVLLCLLHLQPNGKGLVKALPFLRQLSFLEQSKLMEDAMSMKMLQV